MKTITLTALTAILTFAVCSATYAENQSQNQNNQNQKPASQQQAAGSQDNRGADLLVRGTVVSSDPKTNKLVVTDYVTGYDRMFTVAESSVLKDIKKGDSVKVTPENQRPDRASNVEKQQ